MENIGRSTSSREEVAQHPGAAAGRNPMEQKGTKKRVLEREVWAMTTHGDCPVCPSARLPFVPFVCFCSKSARPAKKQDVSSTERDEELFKSHAKTVCAASLTANESFERDGLRTVGERSALLR